MVLSNIIQKVRQKKRGKLTKKWEFQADSPMLTSPVAGDLGDGKKVIVFGTKNGRIYTVDDQSKVKWLYNIQEKRGDVELLFLDEESVRSVRCQPTLADINKDGKNEVIVGSDSGTLHVINGDGKLLWDFSTNAPIRSSAVVEDINDDNIPEVIFGCTDGFLYAVSSYGELIWKFKAGSPIEAQVAVMKSPNHQIIFGSEDGTLYSLNPDGSLRWKFAANDKITAQPAIGDLEGNGKNWIVIGSTDNILYALTEKGELVWSFKTHGSIYSKVCLADINKDGKLEILFGSCDNHIYALSAAGEKIWSYETDFWVVASPFVEDIDNDGKLEVVVGSYDHSLYILDAEGTFILNYMPGISGITQQPGHYSDILTSQPSQFQGKKIWQYKTSGFIVGSALLENDGKKHIVVGTKHGKLKLFTHEKE